MVFAMLTAVVARFKVLRPPVGFVPPVRLFVSDPVKLFTKGAVERPSTLDAWLSPPVVVGVVAVVVLTG